MNDFDVLLALIGAAPADASRAARPARIHQSLQCRIFPAQTRRFGRNRACV